MLIYFKSTIFWSIQNLANKVLQRSEKLLLENTVEVETSKHVVLLQYLPKPLN